MPIYDLYSSRMRAGAAAPDVFEYEKVPDRLRTQVWNIVNGAFGYGYKDYYNSVREYNPTAYYAAIHRAVAHEHGREELAKVRSERRDAAIVEACIKQETDLLVWLDVVELTFRTIERLPRFKDEQRHQRKITIPVDAAISELNERFRRSSFGYRFENSGIVRIDSEYLHAEVTKPALSLLQDPRFAGSNDEFRAAHEHYKAGEFKDCAVDANNALESTLKAICDAKAWHFAKGARASDLVKILKREGLFPDFAEQSFEQLLATVKSGLPTLRNETGGHGQGAEPVEIPEYVAAYALHLAATKIKFLYDAFRASEKTSP